MAKIDLHLHSKFSNRPSEWFLQRLGAAESYSDPENLYHLARKRGMDLVTITDHNRIEASLELAGKYPDHCFTGVEATSYFPEDGCKVHILIYGLDQGQFLCIQTLRQNIYHLRDYLRDQDLACVVAHASYAVNQKLTVEHLEKLILLFNNFEGRNGSRSAMHNDGLSQVLENLTPADIMLLQSKHGLATWGQTPWLKGLTGGSDDHAGLFVGKTYTCAPAVTPTGFLAALKRGAVEAQGRQNDFQGLTFAIYKIAYEFSQQKSSAFASSALSDLSRYLFSEKKLGFKDRIRLSQMKAKDKNGIYRKIAQLIETSRSLDQDDIDSRLDLLYSCISDISDQYFRSLLESLTSDIQKVDIVRVIQGLSSTIPGIFLAIPFFTSFRHMCSDRQLIDSLNNVLGKESANRPKRILWLTDTLTDLNGVSMTLQTIGRLAEEKGHNIRLMASLDQGQKHEGLPQSTLLVQPIHSFRLPHYEQLEINVPSLLSCLKMVYAYNPDEIYVSTPGPLGLLGLTLGKNLGIKVRGIYHTDFAAEAEAIIEDSTISALIDSYNKWFFGQFDSLLVPTQEYMELLKRRGYRQRDMTLFRRGLRTEQFAPKPQSRERQMLLAPRLLYVGRVSKDKNLDFLLRCFNEIRQLHPRVSLTIVGEGPQLKELQENCRSLPGVDFPGRIPNRKLPDIYNAHDLFLFPSVTDTFGMAVLEAQACGLPVLVSNIGGPKEIVADGQTGFVLPVDEIAPWVSRLDRLLSDLAGNGQEYALLSSSSRQRIVNNFCWDSILNEMIKPNAIGSSGRMRKPQVSSFQRLWRQASNLIIS